MSRLQKPSPVKLVIGVFTADRSLIHAVADQLAHRFGRPDMVSPWLAFDETDYYTREMGGPLARRLFAFDRLVDPVDLVEIKVAANALEALFSRDGRRRVNIDPGYLARSRFVLATGKDHTHRIYLSRGIYADLTLIYTAGAFQRLPWTYPDYGSGPLQGYLKKIRNKYLSDLKFCGPLEDIH